MSVQALVIQPSAVTNRERKAPHRACCDLDVKQIAIADGLILLCTVAAGLALLGSAAIISLLA